MRTSAAVTCYGATHDVAQAVTTHLFGISPNHSGSTLLKEALGTSKKTWNLLTEGHLALGFAGPVAATVLWAAGRRRVDRLADSARYDWALIRKAWYFQAQARDPAASVFYTKSPPHLLIVGDLARRFRNAKFLFMVRNPYAVCESLCRYYRDLGMAAFTARFPGRSLPETAAAHVVACLSGSVSTLTHMETADFLYLRGHVRGAGARGARHPGPGPGNRRPQPAATPVGKGKYNCLPTDFNAWQISRLDAGRWRPLAGCSAGIGRYSTTSATTCCDHAGTTRCFGP